MTARPHVTSLVAYRAYFLFVGNVNDPDFFYVVLFVEMIGIFFQQRPIDWLTTIHRPSQSVATIRGFRVAANDNFLRSYLNPARLRLHGGLGRIESVPAKSRSN